MRFVRLTENNHLQLLRNGAEFFPALIASIDNAKREIFLETYLFENDEAGRPIIEALIRAANRGVTVKVILDWTGTGRVQSKSVSRIFKSAGIQCHVFNPWFTRGISRTHRKIVVIDATQAFLGGINIIDDLRADHDSSIRLPAPRWDIAAHITGPLVDDLDRAATTQWERTGSPLQLIASKLRNKRRKRDIRSYTNPIVAALVVRDNFHNRRTIQRTYLQALASASKSAILANPYFAPGRKLRNALVRAASRGVEVTLLLGTGQYHLQDAVAQSYYPQLLAAGVKIFEYRKSQLHGKVAVVDDQWATLGSSNYDGFSLFVNQEANIIVLDPDFSVALRKEIEVAVAESVQVSPVQSGSTHWYKRLWNHFAALLYRNTIRILSSGNSVD